jgi:hypothetical protein
MFAQTKTTGPDGMMDIVTSIKLSFPIIISRTLTSLVLTAGAPPAYAGEAYQVATISSLLAGAYDGDTTVDEMLRHGDFGLGTFNDAHVVGGRYRKNEVNLKFQLDGGERVSQPPLKDKAFSTFLDQNPPFELRRKPAFCLRCFVSSCGQSRTGRLNAACLARKRRGRRTAHRLDRR